VTGLGGSSQPRVFIGHLDDQGAFIPSREGYKTEGGAWHFPGNASLNDWTHVQFEDEQTTPVADFPLRLHTDHYTEVADA
jgi:hypothetical protein